MYLFSQLLRKINDEKVEVLMKFVFVTAIGWEKARLAKK